MLIFCPFCGEEVTSRGESHNCPHCSEDLSKFLEQDGGKHAADDGKTDPPESDDGGADGSDEGARDGDDLASLLKDIETETKNWTGEQRKLADSLTIITKRVQKVESENRNRKSQIAGIENTLRTEDGRAVDGEFFLGRLCGAIFRGELYTKKEYRKDVELIEQAKDEYRVMGIGTSGSGGALVPMFKVPGLITLLDNKTVVKELGATMLDNLTGSPVSWPKETGDVVAEWKGENQKANLSEMAFGELVLTPKEVVAVVPVSKRLLMMSNPSIQQVLNRRLMTRIALAFDMAALRGSGVANEPRGIINTPGVSSYTLENDSGDGAPWSAEDVDNAVYELEAENADIGSLGWAMNPRTARQIGQIRDRSGGADKTGNWMFRDEIVKEGKLASYMVKKTNSIPINLVKGGSNNCSITVFGNWQDCILARWGAMEIEITTQGDTTFLKNHAWIKITLLGDTGVARDESFVVIDGNRPTA